MNVGPMLSASTSTSGTGEYAPIPPGVRALVVVVHALEVLRGGQQHVRRAVAYGEHRQLGSVHALFDHDGRAGAGEGRARQLVAHVGDRFVARSTVTSTPLPAASPSVLITYGPVESRRCSAIAASDSAAVNVRNVAVGTPAARTTCFHVRLGSFEQRARRRRGRTRACPGPAAGRPTRRPAALRGR